MPLDERVKKMDKVLVEKQASSLKYVLDQVQTLRNQTVLALDELNARAQSLDQSLRPVKDTTEDLSRGLLNVEKALKVTNDTLAHFENARRLQQVIDLGLPRAVDAQEGSMTLEAFEKELEASEGLILDYTKAMEELKVTSDFLAEHFKRSSGRTELSQTKDALSMALTHCEVEFTNRLLYLSKAEEIKSDWNALRRKKEVKVLKILAETLLKYEGPSSHATITTYSDVRSTALKDKIDESLSSVIPEFTNNAEEYRKLLQVDNLQQLSWTELPKYVRVWIARVESTFKHVEYERDFAREIFKLNEVDRAFASVIEKEFNSIITKAKGISRSKRTPEKVFALLDMLHAWEVQTKTHRRSLSDILTKRSKSPSISNALVVQSACKALVDIAESLDRMRTSMLHTAQETFTEFISAVERDDIGDCLFKVGNRTKHHVSDQSSLPLNATVHPLTAYIIQYLRRLHTYPNSGSVLFRNKNSGASSEMEEVAKGNVHVFNVLQKALRNKIHSNIDNAPVNASPLKHFRRFSVPDNSITQPFADIFLMNNANYIVESAKEFKVAAAIEESGFFLDASSNIDRYVKSYLHSSWKLSLEWLNIATRRLADFCKLAKQGTTVPENEKNSVKQLLRQFAESWKSMRSTQCAWLVPDTELRHRLCKELIAYVMPVYARCEKYIIEFHKSNGNFDVNKYLPLDSRSIQGCIFDDFFSGKL